MTIKLVGFDLDDCLFDSTGLSHRARIKGIDAMIKLGLDLEREKGIRILDEIVKEYGSNYSEHYNVFFRRINHLESSIDHISYNEQYQYIAAAVMAYHKEKIDNIQLYGDVIPCFEMLKKKAIKTVIVTDGIPIKQYEKILRLKINDLVDLVAISDEIGIRKPNPKLFEYFLNKFGLKGEETIYVGDRLINDIKPAIINKIHAILIHRGGKYDVDVKKADIPEKWAPEFEISNLNQLFPIIDKLNKEK
ncbi:MAG: putative HAD-hydrolase [Promethearchaeota archaeon]|nr:MAG: putative HAD-hydrolase [Candidatus Lokiarchaeota archaeon]